MARLLITLLIICVFTPFSAVYAQEDAQTALELEEHITGLDIEAHFNEIEELYTGKKPDMNVIKEFVEQYPTDDFLFTEQTRTNKGAGEPIFTKKNKTDFIRDTKNNNDQLIDTSIRHTITKLSFLDKITAEVSYTSLFKGKIKRNDKRKGTILIGFKSLSICTSVYKLIEGRIMGQRADCKVDVIYDKPASSK